MYTVKEVPNMKKHGRAPLSRKLYDVAVLVASKKSALWTLITLAFTESFISPIPPDILMLPLMIARKNQTFFIATATAVSAILGGVVAYFIGAALFSTFGSWVIDTYGLTDSFCYVQKEFNKFGFWVLALKGVVPVPFPYKLLAISSGVVEYDFLKFLVASTISRFLKYMIHAVLFYFFQDKVEAILKKSSHIFLLFVLAMAVVGSLLVLILKAC